MDEGFRGNPVYQMITGGFRHGMNRIFALPLP